MSTGTQERREPRGAVEHTAGNARFFYIKYGCLCEVSKNAIEGWKNPIHQLTGEIITDRWIKSPKSLDGWVNKLEWYKRHHGENDYVGWKLHMSAGSDNYILDLPLNSQATQKFMLSARNLDFEFPLEISAWTDKDGKLAVWLKQDDQTVFQYYKKGDMKNCPEPVQKPAIGGGKPNWDWDATDAFLWKEMQEVIAPQIEQIAKERGYQEPAPVANDMPTHSGPAGAVVAYDDSDTIPF